MRRLKMKIRTNITILLILLTFSIFAISPIHAFNITTDKITQTSITWNLTERGANTITELYIDGQQVSVSPNINRYVLSGLYYDEEHIISVTDSSSEISEATATTLPKTTSQGEALFTTINLWILVLLALIFAVAAILVRVPLLAFVGALFCLIGIIGSVFTNFITGMIFIIMFITSLFIGFSSR